MPIVPKKSKLVVQDSPDQAAAPLPPRKFRIRPIAKPSPEPETKSQSDPIDEEATPVASKPSKRKAGKKQPGGEYEVGYCRPPVATRFDGSRPGPGRPPGAVSQDTLLKKHLSQSRRVALEGKLTKVQTRELIVMLQIKQAMEGNRRAIDYVLTNAARLFAERDLSAGGGAASLPVDVDTHDQAILKALQVMLLGEAQPDLNIPAPGVEP